MMPLPAKKRGAVRNIAIVNQSKLLHGCDTAIERMLAAGLLFVNEMWGPAWGIAPVWGGYYRDASKIPVGSYVFRWIDSDKETPGALGYHDEEHNAPYSTLLAGVILNDIGGGILDPNGTQASCSSVFGHELCELLANENVNEWIQMPDGRFIAKEVCDPVQDGIVTIPVGGVPVAMSDAVFPDYFDSQAPRGGRYSVNGYGIPFGCSPGGYQIFFDPSKLHTAAGPVSSVFGASMDPRIVTMKLNSIRKGRTYHRMLGAA